MIYIKYIKNARFKYDRRQSQARSVCTNSVCECQCVCVQCAARGQGESGGAWVSARLRESVREEVSLRLGSTSAVTVTSQKGSNYRSPSLLYRFSGKCAFFWAQYTSGVFVTDKTLNVSFFGIRNAPGDLKVPSVMETRSKGRTWTTWQRQWRGPWPFSLACLLSFKVSSLLCFFWMFGLGRKSASCGSGNTVRKKEANYVVQRQCNMMYSHSGDIECIQYDEEEFICAWDCCPTGHTFC